ncbi:hypothetical protein Tco_0215896 [Tanacetum coccineum]
MPPPTDRTFPESYKEVSTLKKQVSGLNDKLATSDASFAKSKAKGKEKKKKIKSLSKSLDNLHYEGQFHGLVRKFLAADEFSRVQVILQFEPEKLVRPANVPIPMDTRVSPPIAKESTVTPVPKYLELSANVAPVSSAVASEQNEEQGVSHVLDDVVEATAIESERISSVPTDVVVAFSVGGKGDGSVPSSTVKEVVAPPFTV